MGDLPASLAAARQQALAGPGRRRPRPLPQLTPAWENTPEATLPYRTPLQALNNPNTVPYQRQPLQQERDMNRELARLTDRQSIGGLSGHADGREAREFGQQVMEATGAPSWARGINHLQNNQPGEAIPEFLMGALNTGSLATLPYGAGPAARPPPRIPRIPQALPQIAEEARLPNAPARLPGRATDGSVLPILPPQPIRQSMVGSSDDLAEAARMQPDAGGGQGEFNFDEPLYHGTAGAIDGDLRPSRGLPLGNGVYVTPDAEFASAHASKHNGGGAVVPVYARRGRYATGEQYQNTLDNVGEGRNHDAAQAYLESKGYIGVREGREIAVFRPENLTFSPRTQPDGGASGAGNRSLSDRVLEGPPASVRWDGDILRLQDERGSLQARALPGDSVLRVDSLGIASGARSTLGPQILRSLLAESERTGRLLVSDTRLSADAVRSVESLRRLGLTVTKTPEFTVSPTGSHISRNGPLYVITRGEAPDWSRVMDAYFEPNIRFGRAPDAPNASTPRTPDLPRRPTR